MVAGRSFLTPFIRGVITIGRFMHKLRFGENVEQDSYIYRYFSIESFIYLLESKKLTFTHVIEWDDPWENVLSNSVIEKDDGTIEKKIIIE